MGRVLSHIAGALRAAVALTLVVEPVGLYRDSDSFARRRTASAISASAPFAEQAAIQPTATSIRPVLPKPRERLVSFQRAFAAGREELKSFGTLIDVENVLSGESADWSRALNAVDDLKEQGRLRALGWAQERAAALRFLSRPRRGPKGRRSLDLALQVALLGRLQRPAVLKSLRQERRVQARLSEALGERDPQRIDTAFDLLTGHCGPQRAQAFLQAAANAWAQRRTQDVYPMLCMLAMLEVAAGPSGPLADAPRDQVRRLRRQVTRQLWLHPRVQPIGSPSFNDLARALGEAIHQEEGDRAVTAFMGRCFASALVLRLWVNARGADRKPWREALDTEAASGKTIETFRPRHSWIFDDPEIAARFQWNYVMLAAVKKQERDGTPLDWPGLYASALRPLGARASLSQVALQLFAAKYIDVDAPDRIGFLAGGRSRDEDAREKTWLIAVPGATVADKASVRTALFRRPEPLPSGASLDELKAQFIDYFRQLVSPRHLTTDKYIDQIIEKWKAIEGLIHGRPWPRVAPSHVDIFAGDPCNLNCQWCTPRRGASGRLTFISLKHLLKIIKDVHAVNPKAFFRFSGDIGEPLLNKDLIHVLRYLNGLRAGRKRHGWGITTNGTEISDEVMNEMMQAEYVHISLDAGSNETYLKLKKPNNIERPFDQVMENIRRLAALRAKRGSDVRLVVSVLLHDDNVDEIRALSLRLRKLGVDDLQIKMQHYREGGTMSKAKVDQFFDRVRPKILKHQRRGAYRVTVIQDKATALVKIGGVASQSAFHRCWASLLGNIVYSPAPAALKGAALASHCCQAFGRTLGFFGDSRTSTRRLFQSARRREQLRGDPAKLCDDCAPSDEFINRFMEFFVAASQNREFFLWAKRFIFQWWRWERRERREARRKRRLAQAA